MNEELTTYNSPSLSPSHENSAELDNVLNQDLETANCNADPPKKRQQQEEEEDNSSGSESPEKKKTRLATPDETLNSTPTPTEDKTDAITTSKALNKKQAEKLERQKAREIERIEKEKKKEEERLRKEEEKKVKEEERKRKADEKEMEKEARRKKLEDERLERERRKEEDKMKKQAEKEEREKQRLEKKRKAEEMKEQKEIERKKAEEEKRKSEEQKERSQMKISNFFTIGPKRSSPKKNEASMVEDNVILKNEEADAESVYNKVFLPFFQKKNAILAPSTQLSDCQLKKSKEEFDSIISVSTQNPSTSSDLKNFFKSYKPIIKPGTYVSPQDIINALNSSLTTESQVYDMFQKLPPVKYLQFYENSKPPYIGTWCSSQHTSVKIPISNPIDTIASGLNYSYDSDVEWNGDDAEDEGEGEDIDNDDEEDDDEEIDDEEEMDDFVESNELMKMKKRIMGPLVAVSKWNNGDTDTNDLFDEIKFERLDYNITFSIDPFFNYWGALAAEKADSLQAESDATNVTNTVSNSEANKNASPNDSVPLKPTIKDPKAVHELVKFIEKNNDFTIGTLVELSKKEFKTFTKALLKHTIQEIASYNKKSGNWIVKPEFREKVIVESDK